MKNVGGYRLTASRPTWRRLAAIALAVAFLIGMSPTPIKAYSTGGPGRFHSSVLADRDITFCFGSGPTETLYTQRFGAADYLRWTWGAYLGITLTSNGMCDAMDPSNVKIVYDRNYIYPINYECPNSETDDGAFGTTPVGALDWSSITIYITVDCVYEGQFDYDCDNGAPTTGSEPNGLTCLGRVVAHEFGHALGLGHSDTTNAMMWNWSNDAACSYFGTTQRLHYDDTTGIKAQYPTTEGFSYFRSGIVNAPNPAPCYA